MPKIFGILYKYLHSQIFTPSLRFKIRVFIAKDKRPYQFAYYDVMQQILGSYWPDNIQRVKVENVILKKICKIVIIIIVLIIAIYIII